MPPSEQRDLPAQRRRRLLELVVERGSVRVEEMSALFEVTGETIRRDLIWLEEQGQLQRSHGGAVTSQLTETTYENRLHEHEARKFAIAQHAKTLVHSGSTILVDSGTTTRYLAREIAGIDSLTVITNALTTALEFMGNEAITVVSTGGTIRTATLGAVGSIAESTLDSIRVDHVFLATHGFSAEFGLTYPDFSEAAVKKAMIRSGREVTLLADSSKWGRDSLVKVAALTAVDRIITDSGLPDDGIAEIGALGVELIVVPTPEES